MAGFSGRMLEVAEYPVQEGTPGLAPRDAADLVEQSMVFVERRLQPLAVRLELVDVVAQFLD